MYGERYTRWIYVFYTAACLPDMAVHSRVINHEHDEDEAD